MSIISEDLNKKIESIFKSNFPMVDDLDYRIDDNILVLSSSTSIMDLKITLEDVENLEKVFGAEFLGFITTNGRYALRFDLGSV